ncbi:hypothetical protein [Ferribacterium limneticum]|uniref:hypothetical protein n=1 Tax=Ferribacterium limneticum TaxID=76259 RepID=UPI001CF830B9|nr:hypothetical protein [Ferribacterium limneticum]
MFVSHPSSARRALLYAFAASLLLHALILMIPRHDPEETSSPPRLEARLRKPVSTETASAPEARQKPAKIKPERPRLLTTNKRSKTSVASAPQWTAAEKADMNRFLDELDNNAKAAPKPTLAQRSKAMAREEAWKQAREESAGSALLDLRPNATPPDPFSLEMYLEGLLRRLNRSASFVKNDPRAKGMRPASIEFKINPDGSMKSFRVVNAGDQVDEIAFVKAVVERSIPFSPFPADLDKAARSLTMRICINPVGSGEGGFGFTRAGGRSC